MKMNKIMSAALAAVVICAAHIVRAEEHEVPGSATNEPPSEWGYSMSELLMSQYYGTIFGGIFYPGPMSWSDVVASRQDKAGSLTFDLSIGQKLDRLNRYNADGGNEYDFTIDHSLTIGFGPCQAKVDAGVCYLALHDLRNIGDDAFESFVRLDLPIGHDRSGAPIIQPYIEGFHYNEVGDGFRNEGWWTYFGAFRDQALGCKLFGNELKLNIDFRTGASAGAYGSKAGIEYYRLAFALPIVKGKWTVAPSVILQVPGSPGRTYVTESESNIFASLLVKRTF